MKIKVSDYIANFLVEHGVEDVFMVTGGGAMHLDDSLGHKKELNCIFNHHEQGCSMAAEGYARLTGKVAAVCVTSGPGGTNAITGVVGGWQDSIPMFIISGQVKCETLTWSCDVPLRQLGDQEFQIIDMVKNTTKYAAMVTEAWEIRYHLERAWFMCMNGRKGPVWLDIPLDVQGAIVDTDDLVGVENEKMFSLYARENPELDGSKIDELIKLINKAERPLILAGTGINVAGARKEFKKLVETLQIPVVTAWNAHDVLETDNPLFVGKPGTVGTRGGNFVVQAADLLIVLGCRMNIRMISYNKFQFAENAYKVVVDIDANELKKPTVHVDLPIHADVKEFMAAMDERLKGNVNWDFSKWIMTCRMVNKKYPAVLPSYHGTDKLNPYVFMEGLFKNLKAGDVTVCGNGGACVIGFQTAIVKANQRLFTNSGCAAMGYGFPAAIGAAVARKGERVICIDGDGSFMMNMQELQTVVYNKLNIKIVILNNNGYHSIRQTQNNLFKPPLVGVSDGNGISFPDMEKLAYAYGIPYVRCDAENNLDACIKEMLAIDGPVMLEAVVDENQNFEPKLSSKVLEDGKIVSAAIDDMFPFLDREEYENTKKMLLG